MCFIVQDPDPVEVVNVQQYCIVVYSTVQYQGVCFIVKILYAMYFGQDFLFKVGIKNKMLDRV